MNRTRTFSWMMVLVATVMMAAGLLSAAEREYSAWALFAPDTSVTITMTETIGDDIPHVTILTLTLEAIEKDNVKVRNTLTLTGTELYSHSNTLPLIPAWKQGKLESKVTLHIEDRDYACEVWVYEHTRLDIIERGKVWYCPAELLVLQREVAAGDTTTKTHTIHMHESILVDEHEYDCVVLQSSMHGNDLDSESTTWVSRDMPGQLVRSETKATVQGERIIQTSEVTQIITPEK